MAASVKNLREILIETMPEVQIIDRKTEMPFLPPACQELAKNLNRENAKKFFELFLQDMVNTLNLNFGTIQIELTHNYKTEPI
jgi:hypothetical protein